MFCSKCGSRLPDDSVFCPSCGAKLAGTEAKGTDDVKAGGGTAGSAKKADRKAKKGKKSKKGLIIAVAVVAAALILFIIAAIAGDDEEETPNFYEMAESVAPMTEYGYDVTYRQLFDWLIDGEKKSFEQEGSVAYLTYSGNVTGGDHPVSVVLEMTGLNVDAKERMLYPYAMTLNGVEVEDFNDPSGMLSELFWGEKNKEDYPTFMELVNWSSENGITTFDEYFGLNSLPNMFTDAAASVEDAQAIVDAWLAEHPLGPMPWAAPEDEEYIPEDVAETQYSFELWEAPREFLGFIYVRKLDGYMSFTSYHDGPLYDLDEWYEDSYLSEYGSSSDSSFDSNILAPEMATDMVMNWCYEHGFANVEPVDSGALPEDVDREYHVFSFCDDTGRYGGFAYVDRDSGDLYYVGAIGDPIESIDEWYSYYSVLYMNS